MKENLKATLWRVTVFMVLCAFGIFGIVAVFGQFRFAEQSTYTALFANVSGLKTGEFVRIAGVEVGKIEAVSVNADTTVAVEFSLDTAVPLTQGNRAVIRYENLVGDRYMAIEEGAGDTARLLPGQTIPVARTAPALDLDALIGGFRPLFRALNPEQVNSLTSQLIQAFQGQGQVVSSLLAQTASLTSTLADRDQLIGQIIDNLNTVLVSLGEQSQNIDKAVDNVAQLIQGLSDRREDVTNGVANINAVAGSLTGLLTEARPPLQSTATELDRVASIAVADHEYLDNLLNTLPDKYQLLARQGLYGDYFSFYLCDILLKLNGKGGQPVYVKLAEQSTGRCAPK